MKKKLYEKPQMKAIEIKSEQCILSGSSAIGTFSGREYSDEDGDLI